MEWMISADYGVFCAWFLLIGLCCGGGVWLERYAWEYTCCALRMGVVLVCLVVGSGSLLVYKTLGA